MAKYKVLITARSFGTADTKALDYLSEHGCEVKKLSATDGPIQDQLKKELPTADAIIAGLDVYDKDLIKSCPKLKVISRYGVGYDKVDLAAAKSNNTLVTITPGANGDSVADMAVTLMLGVARNVAFMDASIKNKDQKRPTGIEIFEKTLGIVGAGRIGKGVGRRCKGFGMKLLCYDVYKDEAFINETGAEYVDLETIIEKSDFITVHSPLTAETKNMFSTAQFKKMKKTAIIVNTARGGIIDEDALYHALKDGEIYGAGLDVTVKEPPYDSPLLSLPNCIVTPHAAAATFEASIKMSNMAAANAVEVLETGKCKFAVEK